MSIIIDGNAIAEAIKQELFAEIAKCRSTPRFAIYQIGEEESSRTYAVSLEKSAQKLNIQCDYYQEDEDTEADILAASFTALAEDSEVHGLLLLRPLQNQTLEHILSMCIPPHKDIDCANPLSMGLLAVGKPILLPPTPAACIEILKRSGIKTAGKLTAVVGRSNVVGKPLALMLARKGEGDATVVICHSKTADLTEVLIRADIVIAAAGSPRLIKAKMIKPGAVVIDAGINWTEKGMTGDVDFAEVQQKASMITPVPGGLGPVTKMMLFKNLLQAYHLQEKK